MTENGLVKHSVMAGYSDLLLRLFTSGLQLFLLSTRSANITVYLGGGGRV